MDEQDAKEYVLEALRQVVDDAEVRDVPRGIVLDFLSGERFLLPAPVDISDGDVDGAVESDPGEDDEDETREDYDPDWEE